MRWCKSIHEGQRKKIYGIRRYTSPGGSADVLLMDPIVRIVVVGLLGLLCHGFMEGQIHDWP